MSEAIREDDVGAPDEAVEALYVDYLGIAADLGIGSPSGLAALNRSYHKHLLVAAASSLEDRVKRVVPEMFRRNGSDALGEFVSKAVMARNYHTLFDWRAEKATGFFTNFGEACGQNFRSELRIDDELKKQHDAFMRLGSLRNLVVHNDYAAYPIDLTPDEVMQHYRDACAFIARMEKLALWQAPEA